MPRPLTNSSEPPSAAPKSLLKRRTPAWLARRVEKMMVGRVVGTTIILTPLVAIYAVRGLVALMIAGSVAALIAARYGRAPLHDLRGGIDWKFSAAALAFILWSALSLFWSIDLDRSAGVIAKLATIGAAGMAFTIVTRRICPAERRQVGNACIAAAVLGLAIVSAEAVSDLAFVKWLWPYLGKVPPVGFNFLNKPLFVLSAMVPLAAVCALQRGWWWLAVATYCAALAVASQLASGTALLSLTASAGAFVLLGFARNWLRWSAAVAAVVVALCVMPLLGKEAASFDPAIKTMQRLGGSAQHRLAMWGGLSELIRKRPLLGVGIGAVRSMPERYDLVKAPPLPGKAPVSYPILAMHPHNAGLEIAIELGAIGLILAIAVIIMLLRLGFRIGRGRWTATGVTAIAFAASATAMTGLSIWNYSFYSAYLIVFAAAAAAWLPAPAIPAASRRPS